MGKHTAGNRAARGGFFVVTGLIIAFSAGGYVRAIGLIMLCGGLLSIVLAFKRLNR